MCMMIKLKNLLPGVLAMLAVLLLTGCDEGDNPVRTSLNIDTSTMSLTVGESATRKATSDAKDAKITYTSSKPSVAKVDKNGKVTGVAKGEATITASMGETKSGYSAASREYKVVVTNAPVSEIDLSKLTDDYEAQDGDVLKGELAGNYKISIADGASVTLKNVTINGTNSSGYQWAGISCVGDATIVLKNGTVNTVKGFHESYPGIHVPSYKTLTIKGKGSLNASSNGYGAGIGGGDEIACGNIDIQGGTITATGSNDAAGIGSGYNKSCGNITISGGTVTATGGSAGAAGIGSGADESSCGNITITNGVTKVTATKGTNAPNSIGAGYESYCGTVTIGGVVGVISESPYTYVPGAN